MPTATTDAIPIIVFVVKVRRFEHRYFRLSFELNIFYSNELFLFLP